MKRILPILAVTAVALLNQGGCATIAPPPSAPAVDNAATRTGQNLVGAVAEVMQDYADVQKDGVASLWSISKGANALGIYVKTRDDIKQLVADWKSTAGDSLPQRIANVLRMSDASPQTQAAVVAKAAETVAANKGP
jgi:hypothetical protein